MPLLDDVQVLDAAVFGFDDAVAGGIEAQLAVLDQEHQLGVVHLLEGRIVAQELQGALDILQDCSLAGFGKGVRLAHLVVLTGSVGVRRLCLRAPPTRLTQAGKRAGRSPGLRAARRWPARPPGAAAGPRAWSGWRSGR
ncbi:hypothetical protein D3C78_1483040 [compost metagenome]